MFKRLSITAIASLALLAANANIATAAEPTKDEPAAAAGETPASKSNPISIAFMFGHGEKDAFKTGIGGRIGYTLRSGLYFGGSYVSHFGMQDGPVQASIWYAGGEVGYELEAGPLIVRPYAGAGLASIYASVFMPPIGSFQGGKIEASDRRFAVWPGASVLLPIDRAFIGVDAKFLVVENSNAFNAYGTLGVAF